MAERDIGWHRTQRNRYSADGNLAEALGSNPQSMASTDRAAPTSHSNAGVRLQFDPRLQCPDAR